MERQNHVAEDLILVAIPAFNEEGTVGKVVAGARMHADVVLVCDDGSTDRTRQEAEEAGAKVVLHPRNMGYGKTVRDLMVAATAYDPEVVVLLDGDGQHDPSDIPRFVAELRHGSDLAIGVRSGEGVPAARRLGMKVLDAASGMQGLDTQCGYRAFNRSSLSLLLPTEMGMGAASEILRLAGELDMKVAQVPVRVDYEGNTPSQSPVYHGLEVVMASLRFSVIRHPLVYFGLPGVGALCLALLLWTWALFDWFRLNVLDLSIAIVATLATLVGFSLVSMAVILWVMIAVVRLR